MRARGGDLIPETIPFVGLLIVWSDLGVGTFDFDRQKPGINSEAVTKSVPRGFLRVTLLEKGVKLSFVLIAIIRYFKVARYSFSGSIPPKFERKLRRHKQRFGKINTTVVLDKDENLLWSGLQWHRSCHSNEMTPLPILLPAVFLGTGNCSSKIVYWSFYLR